MNEDDKKTFEELSGELIKFLCKKGHPHMTVIVTPVSAELVEGTFGYSTEEHLKD